MVHNADVACDMDAIMAIAGRQLGIIGALAALSFRETKNLISGEGGAPLITGPQLVARAEIIGEKGTNRS